MEDSVISYSEQSECEQLKSALAAWNCKYNVSHASLTALLHIPVLRKHFPLLPLTAATVMETNKVSPAANKSDYYYFGIRSELLSSPLIQTLPSRIITIQINIDGLPLFKSSNIQLWPILGLIEKFEGRSQRN